MKWQSGSPVPAQPAPVAQTAQTPTPETATPPAPEPLTQPAPAPAAQPERRTSRAAHTAPRHETPEPAARPEPAPAASAAPAPAAPPAPAAANTPAAEAPQPEVPAILANVPPPPPRKVTIPGGTLLPVRTVESISSDRNHTGDTFSATLEEPLVVEGLVIAERGARVQGRVVETEMAGRVRGVSHLTLELTQFTTSDGQRVGISTETFAKQGETSRKSDAAKVGAAAGIGAAIGAIAGGGKGAGLGAVLGGAAGGGGVAATRGKATVIPSETHLSFRLKEPVTVTEKRRQ
jgi:hypothetical protein